MRKKLVKIAFLNVLGEGIYVFLLALFLSSMERIFGNTPDNHILAPLTFLFLFVLSASISGALILGRPALMYMDGKKKEALELFGFTLLWLFVFIIIFFIALLIWR